MHFLTHSSISKMESLKNKQAAKNRQEEIKKVVVAQRAQGGGSSAPAPHASKKRKYPSDVQSSGKGVGGSFVRSDVREGAINPPCHKMGKGLMTSQGPVVPPPFPLLVKDKGYAVDTTRSIVRDADLDDCSEHKTDPLCDSGLHDMTRVSLTYSSLIS